MELAREYKKRDIIGYNAGGKTAGKMGKNGGKNRVNVNSTIFSTLKSLKTIDNTIYTSIDIYPTADSHIGAYKGQKSPGEVERRGRTGVPGVQNCTDFSTIRELANSNMV